MILCIPTYNSYYLLFVCYCCWFLWLAGYVCDMLHVLL